MSFLPDTLVFIWFDVRSPRLSEQNRGLVARTDQAVYLCAVSFWEIAITRRDGKLNYDGAPRTAAADAGVVELAIEAADAEVAGALDASRSFRPHAGGTAPKPFYELVTADAKLPTRDDVAILWAG